MRMHVGIGLATTSGERTVDVRFVSILDDPADPAVALLRQKFGDLATGQYELSPSDAATLGVPAPAHPFHDVRPVAAVVASPDDAPVSAADVYLRLHLLSLRLARPRTLNLDGAFGKLNTNVWTTEGVIDQERFDEIQRARVLAGSPLVVLLQDKFPRLLDYVSPSGVRILNPNNVRLGAHLAPGTVVMTAGAVNFNAGTLGEAMIEGRVSAGVIVGARSDVGGGASLMGTLSGGNDVTVSVGEDCLIEAMGGLGIPVGDRVRVEVGFYVKSTTPLLVVDSMEWRGNPIATPHVGSVVKAIALAGISDAVFRRNARNGTPEVVSRGDRVWGKLNAELHKN